MNSRHIALSHPSILPNHCQALYKSRVRTYDVHVLIFEYTFESKVCFWTTVQATKPHFLQTGLEGLITWLVSTKPRYYHFSFHSWYSWYCHKWNKQTACHPEVFYSIKRIPFDLCPLFSRGFPHSFSFLFSKKYIWCFTYE